MRSHTIDGANTVRISAALIVRNEEKTLGRCLQSIKDRVDEIIVVDTGSEDETKTIAGQYTDRIYDFPWCKDFAAARQFSFDRATGDWVLWLDADDVVLGAEKIRQSLQDTHSGVKGFYWKYIAGQDEYGNSTCEFWRERCVRNDGTFRWVGRVHEALVAQQPCVMARNAEIAVMHHRELTRGEAHSYRNIEILEAEYAEAAANPDPRLLLYMGNEYADLGKLARAIEFLQRYVQASSWDEEKYLAQVRIAALYRRQADYENALDADLRSLKICPHWPNAYFGLVETYYFLRDWAKVIYWVELACRLPLPDTICIVNPMDYRYNWIIYYTNALYHVGRVPEALAWTQKAMEIRPGDVWHRSNQGLFAETIQATEFFSSS